MANALYRKYRPDTLAKLIGQEQVAEPLARALDSGKLNHAYLFSGPRGCGKTSSARIFARSINCIKGPTSNPCGECDSCVELSTNGSGSVDVIEFDAASHRGIEDAKILRDQASYLPARDKYKIFIIDEAHMITKEGFNALLKIVEEPPEHVIFIFATTEYQKVMITIRSRTYHYTFKLVQDDVLAAHLKDICEKEGYQIDDLALNYIVKSSEGAVRDALSILDQLFASANEKQIDGESAANLLGITPENMIQEVVNALVSSNSAELFERISQISKAGLDAKLFTSNLLDFFRNLLVISAYQENANSQAQNADALRAILFGVTDTNIQFMKDISSKLGFVQILNLADIIANSINSNSNGKTYLELLAANLIVQISGKTTNPPLQASKSVQPTATQPVATPPAVTQPAATQAAPEKSNPPKEAAQPQTPSSEKKIVPQKTNLEEPIFKAIEIISGHNDDFAKFLEDKLVSEKCILQGEVFTLEFKDEESANRYLGSEINNWLDSALGLAINGNSSQKIKTTVKNLVKKNLTNPQPEISEQPIDNLDKSQTSDSEVEIADDAKAAIDSALQVFGGNVMYSWNLNQPKNVDSSASAEKEGAK